MNKSGSNFGSILYSIVTALLVVGGAIVFFKGITTSNSEMTGRGLLLLLFGIGFGLFARPGAAGCLVDECLKSLHKQKTRS